jgi:hypothetical protein
MNPLEILESVFLTLEHTLKWFGEPFYWLGIWMMNLDIKLIEQRGEEYYRNYHSDALCLICGYPQYMCNVLHLRCK